MKKVIGFEDRILQLRSEGMSKENIALELEIHKSIVYRVLKEHDPKPEKMLRCQEILDLYDGGMTYQEISQKTGKTLTYVGQSIWRYSKSFEPVGKLNYRPKTQMTKAEQHRRKRLMTRFLLEKEAADTVVIVMRDDQYHLRPESLAVALKIKAAFPKEDVIRATAKHIIVRKVFAS